MRRHSRLGRTRGRRRVRGPWRHPSRWQPAPSWTRASAGVGVAPGRLPHPQGRCRRLPVRSRTTDNGSSGSNLCSNLNIGKRDRNLRPVVLPMRRPLSVVVWALIAVLGAIAFGVLALARGETINAAWLLIAAVCTYVIGYRFYSKFLATRVFGLDPRRATPAERFNNGRDFV